MADNVLDSIAEAAKGFADFARGKVNGLLDSGDSYGRGYDRKAAPPSADAAKKLAQMAEESARRNGVKPPRMTSAAKKALTTR